MIITDAEIEETPIFEGSICDKCGKCADICPLGAIDKNNLNVVEICGKKMEVATIDFAKCRSCKNGACASRFGEGLKPDRVAALCNRTCLGHLEEIEALDNKFNTSFRKREHWAIGDKNAQSERDTQSHNVLGGQFSKGAK
jgi:ferredoxin